MKYIRKKSAKKIAFLIAFMLGAGFLYPTGDDTQKQPTVTDPSFVDTIVVEGEAIADTATVQLVTAKDIQAKNCKTVAEALETVPGAHVRIGAKGEAYIRLRGFRQREVALLIDGIPISSPYDGQLDLAGLPVESIDRIEVVKGASSVLYGSNAMGGVINIITKKSNGADGFSISGQYGTGETADLGASVQGSLGNVRYLLTGSYFNRDHYQLSGNYGAQSNQEQGARENSDKKAWSGKISLGWDMGNEGQAALSFSHIDQAKGLPHHVSDKKAKFWRFDDWREGILDFVFQDKRGNLSYKSKLYYQYFENILDSFDDRTYTTQAGKYAFTDTLKDYALGGDVFFRLSMKKKHLLKMALRFRQDTHRQQSDPEDPWRKYRMNTMSLPLEGEWLPATNLTFIYGVSFDFMNFRSLESGNGESNSASSINPQAAGILRVSDTLRLRASASRKTRFPNLKELFSTTSGNPELDTMKSNVFELGAEFQPAPDVTFSLVGFYNDVKDLINRDKKYDPYINVDEAVFKGFETSVDWRFTSRGRFSAAYTHLQAVDKSKDGNNYIQYRPKHKVDVRLSAPLPFGLYADVNLGYVSKQVYYDDDEAFSLEPYTLLDVKVTKQLGDQWRLFLSVHNLFDADYYESEGYPREGRTIAAGIRFTAN